MGGAARCSGRRDPAPPPLAARRAESCRWGLAAGTAVPPSGGSARLRALAVRGRRTVPRLRLQRSSSQPSVSAPATSPRPAGEWAGWQAGHHEWPCAFGFVDPETGVAARHGRVQGRGRAHAPRRRRVAAGCLHPLRVPRECGLRPAPGGTGATPARSPGSRGGREVWGAGGRRASPGAVPAAWGRAGAPGVGRTEHGTCPRGCALVQSPFCQRQRMPSRAQGRGVRRASVPGTPRCGRQWAGLGGHAAVGASHRLS